MYVKLRQARRWSEDYKKGVGIFNHHLEEVVPMDTHLFETEKVRYNKFRVFSEEEFLKYIERYTIEALIIYGPPEIHSCGESGKCSDCGKGAEFLLIELENNENCRQIVAADCVMFIMNETGKTIDSIGCY